MTVNVGDKLTTVVSWSDPTTGAFADGCVVRTTVTRSRLDEVFSFVGGELFLPNGTTVQVEIVGDFAIYDEDIAWIRGWPALDSPEVQALVVAHAMEPGAIPSRLFTEHTSPGYGYDSEMWRYDLDGYMDDDFEARGLIR